MTTSEKRNWHAIEGPNGRCACGQQPDGTFKDCAQLLAEEVGRENRTLRAALEKALLGIDDVAAQASLCAHHVVPHEHQRTWLRSEVRREADGAQRAIRAALAASAPAVPASTPAKLDGCPQCLNTVVVGQPCNNCGYIASASTPEEG
jgi:hypothetical protein